MGIVTPGTNLEKSLISVFTHETHDLTYAVLRLDEKRYAWLGPSRWFFC